MNNPAFIILAAGTSSRLGRPKQLLPLHKETLLGHAITAALETRSGPVYVVLGAQSERIKESIAHLPVSVLMNDAFAEGIATSIRTGITGVLSSNPEAEGAVLMVSDQPFICAMLLSELINRHEQTKKGIIASFYNKTVGVPAFFCARFFPQLMELQGDEGAKKIMITHPDDLETVSFEEGNIDIDTMEDYNRLYQDLLGK